MPCCRSRLRFFFCSLPVLRPQSSTYLGFDRNEYPGDANLKTLRQTFSYTGYWLNKPPGMSSNNWTGHRAAVESAGFGFLVLFNGRLYAELKTVANARGSGDPTRGLPWLRAQARRIPACDHHFSGSGTGRPHASRAEGLHLCLGRRRDCGRIPRGNLLFRHSRAR